MGKVRGLIVEDKLPVAELAVDILEGIGHKVDVAYDLECARRLLRNHPFNYGVIDLQIPSGPGRTARQENGEQLAEEINADPKLRFPVMIATSHGKQENELAVRLIRTCASDFINKPYEQTLAPRVLKMLEVEPPQERISRARRRGQLTPFLGCEILVYPDRVSACGIDIIQQACQMRDIMEIVATEPGQDSESLASRLGTSPHNICKTISRNKRTIFRRLEEQKQLACDENDILAHDKFGYRFAENVTVRVVKDDEPVDSANTLVREGAKWIEHQLVLGTQLTWQMFSKKFGASKSTFYRCLKAVREKGIKVAFEGAAKGGYYRLKGD